MVVEHDDALEEFARELVITARRWRTRLDERLRPLGMSEARWAVLQALRAAPTGLSQTELAERAGVESPSLVRTLDILCEAGLVERRPSARDRRTNLVVLTPAALPVLRRMYQATAELRRELMGGFDREDLHASIRTMYRLRRQLDGAPAKPALRLA